MEQESHPTRIVIVGCGNVGATYAYALLLNRLSSEIVLIDADRAKAEGEAMDLEPCHAVRASHAYLGGRFRGLLGRSHYRARRRLGTAAGRESAGYGRAQ